MDSVIAVSTHYKRFSFLLVHNRSPFRINIKVAQKLTLDNDTFEKHWKIKVFRATDKQGIVLKTEYDAEAAFLTLYMGEQERRFFHALCYAVGAEKALLQAVLRARIWRGKGFIPYPPKPRFYCVTNPKQRSYELWQFSEWNGTRATP